MKITRRSDGIGIALILSTGIVHMSMFREEYAEAPYLGVMFLGAFIGSILAATAIYRQELLWGWGIGAFIALGSIAGYLLSRTVGLPVSGIEPWGPASGYVSLVAEILFVVLSVRLPEFKNLIGKVIQSKAGHRTEATRADQKHPLPVSHD